jgi:hypothetical protein
MECLLFNRRRFITEIDLSASIDKLGNVRRDSVWMHAYCYSIVCLLQLWIFNHINDFKLTDAVRFSKNARAKLEIIRLTKRRIWAFLADHFYEMISYCCHLVCVCMYVCPMRELWPDSSSLEPDFLDISISLYLTRGGAVRISSALT